MNMKIENEKDSKEVLGKGFNITKNSPSQADRTSKDLPLPFAIAENLNRKLFICPYGLCKRIFKEKGNLRTHIRVHTGERPFVCTYVNCGKTFITLGNLKSHICNHTGEKPYACTFENCGKKYSRLCRLKIHRRTHTGEKPFKCEFPNCGKAFNEKGNLKTHMRIHTGEKPYVCNQEGCSQAFKAHGHLKDHLKRHLNLRPFECNICKAKFSRTSTLKIHYHTHRGDKPFKCQFPECNKQFAGKGNMKMHFKIMHEKYDSEEIVNSSDGKKCKQFDIPSSGNEEGATSKAMNSEPKPCADVHYQEASPNVTMLRQNNFQSSEVNLQGTCPTASQLSPQYSVNENVIVGIPQILVNYALPYQGPMPMYSFISQAYAPYHFMSGFMDSYGYNAINPNYHVYLNNLMQSSMTYIDVNNINSSLLNQTMMTNILTSKLEELNRRYN